MRLLIVLNTRFPTEKAYGLQVLAMARGCVQAGIEVAVAYPRRTSETPAAMPGVRFFPYGPQLEVRAPWMFHPLRVIGLFGLRKIADQFKPDFVLANDPLQAAYFPKPWRVIWDLHDMPDPNRVSRRYLIGRILKRASGILSTNETKLRRLRELGFSLPPSIVLPNPLTLEPEAYQSITKDAARSQCGISSAEKAVVYAGRLYEWKGVDTLVAAAALLPASYKVHIVGGEGKNTDRVVFHGSRPPEEIPAWLRAADIIAVPNSGRFRISREDTNPMKLYEALAAGASVVASDLPSIREAVNGVSQVRFFTPDDATSLANAIIESVEQPAASAPTVLMTAKERAQKLAAFGQNLA